MRALIELEDRILERALGGARAHARVARARSRSATTCPRNVLERLAQIGVLTPNARGYDADDVKIIEAISRFRAGGYDEALGFTVYDTLRYREALQPLVEEEVRVLLGRLAGEVERRPRGRDHRRRRRAAARADRRDALQAAARRAAPPARAAPRDAGQLRGRGMLRPVD